MHTDDEYLHPEVCAEIAQFVRLREQLSFDSSLYQREFNTLTRKQVTKRLPGPAKLGHAPVDGSAVLLHSTPPSASAASVDAPRSAGTVPLTVSPTSKSTAAVAAAGSTPGKAASIAPPPLLSQVGLHRGITWPASGAGSAADGGAKPAAGSAGPGSVAPSAAASQSAIPPIIARADSMPLSSSSSASSTASSPSPAVSGSAAGLTTVSPAQAELDRAHAVRRALLQQPHPDSKGLEDQLRLTTDEVHSFPRSDWSVDGYSYRILTVACLSWLPPRMQPNPASAPPLSITAPSSSGAGAKADSSMASAQELDWVLEISVRSTQGIWTVHKTATDFLVLDTLLQLHTSAFPQGLIPSSGLRVPLLGDRAVFAAPAKLLDEARLAQRRLLADMLLQKLVHTRDLHCDTLYRFLDRSAAVSVEWVPPASSGTAESSSMPASASPDIAAKRTSGSIDCHCCAIAQLCSLKQLLTICLIWIWMC